MNILVTGGAGYIGSHCVKRLLEDGHCVSVVDNLNMGHRQAVSTQAKFHELDIRQTQQLADILKQDQIQAVYHFAALASVGESVEKPLLYYDNNSAGSISLLRACDQAEVKRLVFSSTCATYGEPAKMPIVETMDQQPINAYGASKLVFEKVLLDYIRANPSFAFTALRYFNVAGCASDGSIGEDHSPESHIIPVVLQAALGKRTHVSIFGTDYATPDGTCIRDYVYVEDLINAHVIAMDQMAPGQGCFYNLGIGRGYSVKEIIESAKRVTGIDFKVKIATRREGDPPQLYANASKIQNELGWRAAYTNIDDIVATAWAWFQSHPNGYE